jgi:hypothetical protein
LVGIAYITWIAFLGAIGSTAFVGMNALSVQSDATFDLNNQRLLVMRVSLGALFGLVLTLPFGMKGFVSFFDNMNSALQRGNVPSQNSETLTTQMTVYSCLSCSDLARHL